MAALPPMSEVIDALRTAVLPAAGAAAGVYFVASLLPLVRRTALPAALAIACGFLAGNWQRDAVEFRLHSEHRLQAKELGRSLQAAVTGVNDHGAVVPTARFWLPWIVVAGLLASVAAGMARSLGWWLKLIVAVLGGWLLSPAETQNQHIAYTVGYALLAMSIWWVLDEFEAGGLLPFTASLAAGAAGTLMLFAASLRYSDIGVLASSALMGVAVLAWWFQSDAAAVAAVPALGVPGLMLIAQHDSSSQVPAMSYSLMAAAPLALGLLSLPGFGRLAGRGRATLTMLLWLTPAAVSIYLASRVEVLDF
jgi:hypothetical protein